MRKAWICCLLLVIAISFGGCGKEKEPETIVLKRKLFEIELGDVISDNPEDYLIGDKSAFEKAVIDVSGVKDKVGTYEAAAWFKEEKLPFKVKVVDTTAPEIQAEDTLEVVAGEPFSSYLIVNDIKDESELEDYTIGKYVTAVSSGNLGAGMLPDYTLVINDVGVASVVVSASDSFGNKSNKVIKVTVKEKKKEVEKQESEKAETASSMQATTNKAKPVQSETIVNLVKEEQVEEPYVGNCGHTFESFSEADNYAMETIRQGKHTGYDIITDGFGGYTVDFY